MELELLMLHQMTAGPWYWNSPDDEMREYFLKFLKEKKGYKVTTDTGRLGIMWRYIDIVNDIAKKDKVTWGYVGVNIDDFISRYANEGRTVLKALQLYKECLS